jgi:hypothetical protein
MAQDHTSSKWYDRNLTSHQSNMRLYILSHKLFSISLILHIFEVTYKHSFSTQEINQRSKVIKRTLKVETNNMELELVYNIYTHKVLCTWYNSTFGSIAFICMLYSTHKIKNKLGAQERKKSYSGTETYRKFLTWVS